jgi:hypothetical protein
MEKEYDFVLKISPRGEVSKKQLKRVVFRSDRIFLTTVKEFCEEKPQHKNQYEQHKKRHAIPVLLVREMFDFLSQKGLEYEINWKKE